MSLVRLVSFMKVFFLFRYFDPLITTDLSCVFVFYQSKKKLLVRVWTRSLKGKGMTNQRPKGLVSRKREVPRHPLLVRMTSLKLPVLKAKKKRLSSKSLPLNHLLVSSWMNPKKLPN